MPRVIASVVALVCAICVGDLAAQEQTDSRVRPAKFDPDLLSMGRDSFAILLQGNEFGSFVRTHEGGPTGFTTTTRFVISGGAQSATYVLDGTTLAPASYDQTANQGGQSIELHLTFSPDGHITGTIAGAFEATVDTVMLHLPIIGSIVNALAIARFTNAFE